ncbi:MAG: hypothetical protein ACI8RD_010576, partial [Bacillariaceae sp.]
GADSFCNSMSVCVCVFSCIIFLFSQKEAHKTTTLPDK